MKKTLLVAVLAASSMFANAADFSGDVNFSQNVQMGGFQMGGGSTNGQHFGSVTIDSSSQNGVAVANGTTALDLSINAPTNMPTAMGAAVANVTINGGAAYSNLGGANNGSGGISVSSGAFSFATNGASASAGASGFGGAFGFSGFSQGKGQ